MKPLTKILLVICTVGFVVGLADTGNAMFSGMARAIGAVFFILFFNSRVLEITGGEEKSECKKDAAAEAAPPELASHGHSAV